MSNELNPKDLAGLKKVHMALFPPAGIIYGAAALQDGVKKYGPFNWRGKKIHLMNYISATQRHLAALVDGEDFAPDSGLHHIAHVVANGGILADAIEGGFLIDDRPAKGPAAELLEKLTKKT
jgi:hypothetical protein